MTTNLETLGACVHLTQNLDPFRVLESSGCFVNRAGEEIEKRKGKGGKHHTEFSSAAQVW